MAEWGDFWGELWGGAISLITTHEQDAVNRLKFHLDGKGNAEAVVEIFAERWQILENFLSDLLTLIDLDASFGDVQDKLGALLNVSRRTFDDDDYRTLLRTKALLVLRRRRTVEGLLTIARSLMGPKVLTSLEPIAFDADLATLTDRITASLGTADGTSYEEALDARRFDGATDRIDWTPAVQDLAGSAFTVSMRVNIDALGGFQVLWSSDSAAGVQSSFIDVVAGGEVRVLIEKTGLDVIRATTPTLTPGTETEVTVTYDGNGTLASGIKVYFDGFEVSAYASFQDGTLLDTAMGFRWSFGGREQADDRNFDGTLRGIRIWDRELSGAEVLTLFQGGKRFIDYSETYPKSYQLTLEGLTTNEEIIFRDFLRVARPATYNGTVLVVPDPAFGYDDSTATVVTDVEGFADATKTIDVGGPYAHVIIL